MYVCTCVHLKIHTKKSRLYTFYIQYLIINKYIVSFNNTADDGANVGIISTYIPVHYTYNYTYVQYTYEKECMFIYKYS